MWICKSTSFHVNQYIGLQKYNIQYAKYTHIIYTQYTIIKSVYITRQAIIDKRTKPFCFYEWYWIRVCATQFSLRVMRLCIMLTHYCWMTYFWRCCWFGREWHFTAWRPPSSVSSSILSRWFRCIPSAIVTDIYVWADFYSRKFIRFY